MVCGESRALSDTYTLADRFLLGANTNRVRLRELRLTGPQRWASHKLDWNSNLATSRSGEICQRQARRWMKRGRSTTDFLDIKWRSSASESSRRRLMTASPVP